MLGVTAFLPAGNSFSTLIAFPRKFPPTFSLFSPNSSPKSSSLALCSSASFFLFSSGRTGLSISASNKPKTSNSFTNIDDEDDSGEEEEEEEEEDEEVEEGEEKIMGFDEMQKWFRNKPSGFGEGKTYDTSIEEKLLEEIEVSRTAQLANIDKLKNSSPPEIAAKKKQGLLMPKAVEAVPSEFQVRVGNLPKKKNIHRDLQSAFKEFPGIVNISPAVSGNKKTRDPICKGFAFLYFESEKAAHSFVQTYSGQNIPFGKIQKPITCEIANPRHSSESSTEQLAISTSLSAPRLRILDMREETYINSDTDSLTLDSQGMLERSAIATGNSTEMLTELVYNMDDEPMFSDMEVIEDINMPEPNNKEKVRPRIEDNVAIVDSTSLKQRQKNRVVQKQKIVKGKSDKDLRLNVPGSSKRLKIKERAVLTGVFSKYSGKADSGER